MARYDFEQSIRALSRVLALCSFLLVVFASPLECYILVVLGLLILAVGEYVGAQSRATASLEKHLVTLRDSSVRELETIKQDFRQIEIQLIDVRSKLNKPTMQLVAEPRKEKPVEPKVTTSFLFLVLTLVVMIGAFVRLRDRSAVAATEDSGPRGMMAVFPTEQRSPADQDERKATIDQYWPQELFGELLSEYQTKDLNPSLCY